jgi:hypothetical protein
MVMVCGREEDRLAGITDHGLKMVQISRIAGYIRGQSHGQNEVDVRQAVAQAGKGANVRLRRATALACLRIDYVEAI